MDESTVIAMWPRPGSVVARWSSACLRIRLQLVYGRTSERRRARILARRAENRGQNQRHGAADPDQGATPGPGRHPQR